MTREPIIQSSDERTAERPSLLRQTEDDRALRPQSMREMVGQRAVYERIQIAVDAARKRDEPLGHILFDGPPGLGKTTFATCIPRDLGVNFQIGSGATLKAPKDLIPYLTNAEERSILFIDEIHRMQKAVEEFLYPAMEDFRIDLGALERAIAADRAAGCLPFCVIGAAGTTNTGAVDDLEALAPLDSSPRPLTAGELIDDEIDRVTTVRAVTGPAAPTLVAAVVGVHRHGRVLIVMLNRPEYLETVLAINLLGAIAVPVNFRMTPPEIAYLVEDSGARTIVTEAALAPVVAKVRETVGSIESTVVVGGETDTAAHTFASTVV